MWNPPPSEMMTIKKNSDGQNKFRRVTSERAKRVTSKWRDVQLLLTRRREFAEAQIKLIKGDKPSVS